MTLNDPLRQLAERAVVALHMHFHAGINAPGFDDCRKDLCGEWHRLETARIVAEVYPDSPRTITGDEAPPTSGRPLPDKYVRPITIIGDGQPLPLGVWVARYSSDSKRYYSHCGGDGKLTIPGWTYTYVGPVSAAEQEKA